MPTPRSKRLPLMAATDVASLAKMTGLRIGSFKTAVWKRIVEVPAAMAAVHTSGSINGLFSRNSRDPSGV